uniref:F-box domain-containing protein n=1 Tax=Oryza meridionalis TaxID=40149 RepID=A0A0E0FES2_9ORYZ
MDCCSQLSGDLLADILCRAVCHAWRAIVDDHSLTTQAAALLPNHLHGLFVGLNESCLQGFFARPSPPAAAAATIPGIDLDYDLDDDATIEVHCNGLLFCSIATSST